MNRSRDNSHHMKLLMVFPHNPSEMSDGVNRRFWEIVKYLSTGQCEVDLLGLKNMKSIWPVKDDLKDLPGIRKLYLYDHSRGLRIALFRSIARLDLKAVRNLLEKDVRTLPDYAFKGLRKLFRKLVTAENYDIVLISYVQWANLLADFPDRRFRTVITIEDCLSQNLIENGVQHQLFPSLLDEEAGRIDLFDHAICISAQEMKLFSSKTNRPVYHYVPVFMNKVEKPQGMEVKYDILFVGSDHPSNQRGVKWFMQEVVKRLPADIKICFAGRICDIAEDHPNLVKLGFIRDLSTVYHQSKMTINPMVDGTGMKVKLVESLAHGVPIVTTGAGLSGIPVERQAGFLIADDAESFAAAVMRLAGDFQFYQEYSQCLRKMFVENYTVEAVKDSLDNAFS